MTTNYYLTPVFHIVFRKKNGQPAINGSVQFSRAADHNTRKDIYEDKNGLIPLPNPVNLNDGGVIADINGNPKPLYWASDEDYFVEVFEGPNATGQLVQTVDDYNSNLADFPIPSIEDSNLNNYMLNPQFRYFEKQNLSNSDLPSAQEIPIAEEGWFFYRDTANSTNQIDFVEFTLGQIDVPFNPKYYLKFECTIPGTETRKDICLPLKDVVTFSNETMCFALWGRSLSGNPANIQLVLRQFFGTGGSSVVETIIQTLTLTTSWTQLIKENFIVPNVAGKTIGTGGDDRIEICLRMPLNQVAQLGLVNTQLNQSDILLDFNYITPEKEQIIKKAYELPNATDDNYGHPLTWDGSNFVFRDDTGKIEEYLLGDLPPYCLPMADQSHQRLAFIPGTNNRVRYNRLYQKWENDSNIGDGNAFGYGNDGFFPKILYANTAIFINTKAGSVINWTDHDTGFTITTLHEGGALTAFSSISFIVQDGSIKDKNGIPITLSNTSFQITNAQNGSVPDISPGTSGFLVNTLQEGTASLPEISLVKVLEAALPTIAGKYFLIDTPVTNYYIWYKRDGVGTDPAVGGRTGVLVEIASTNDAPTVAYITQLVMAGHEVTKVVCNAASTLSGGEYFNAHNTTEAFYVWYTVDGVGVDPEVALAIGIKVEVLSTDTNAQVAQKTSKAISSWAFTIPTAEGYFLRGWSNGSSNDADRLLRWSPIGSPVGDKVGSYQKSMFLSHDHDGVGATRASDALETADIDIGGNPDTGKVVALSRGGKATRPINLYVQFAIKY